MSETDNRRAIVDVLAQELDLYTHDYSSLDGFYDAYEQYCIGLSDVPPSVVELDESEHSQARYFATFLDWKYEKGLEESTHRDIDAFEMMNEFFLQIKEPQKFISWVGSLAKDA